MQSSRKTLWLLKFLAGILIGGAGLFASKIYQSHDEPPAPKLSPNAASPQGATLTATAPVKNCVQMNQLEEANSFAELGKDCPSYLKTLFGMLESEELSQKKAFDLYSQRELWKRILNKRVVSYQRSVFRSPQFREFQGYDILKIDFIFSDQSTGSFLAYLHNQNLFISWSKANEDFFWQEGAGFQTADSQNPNQHQEGMLKISTPLLSARQ